MKPEKQTRDGHNSAIGALLLLILAPIWIPLLVLGIAFYLAAFICFHLAVWTLWLPRHKRLLFVYSNSPIWQSHIEAHILPRISEHAVILNWSQRRQWSFRQALAVAVFRYFGGSREFNPMAIVFRPFRLRRVFRFFQPFHDLKHGKLDSLARVETDFFQYLHLNEI